MPLPILSDPEYLALLPEDRKEYKRRLEGERERERIKQAHDTFTGFFAATTPFKPEPMQAHMGNLIERISIQREAGLRELEHKPPQHGGSIAITQEFVPFYLGHNPEKRVRLLTYNITHSEHFSDTIIRIMQSPEYKEIFPNKDCWLPDRVRASEWSTNLRASINDSQHSFMALGLQTGFVGSGGDLILVDDAYANDKDPFSDVINLGLRKTFNEVILTRANPDTNIIVMAHSWNDKDLRAWLIEQGGWNDTKYSAICESENDPLGRELGEALSPRYPIEYLIRLRDGGTNEKGEIIQGMGMSAFNSLYQGNGTSRDGSDFTLDMFKYVDDYRRMPGSFFIRAWDWASSAQKTADKTSGSLWYFRPDKTYTKVNCSWGRFNPSGTEEFIYNTSKNDREVYSKIAPVISWIEKPFGAAEVFVDSICRKCAEFGMRQEKVTKDKATRALPLRAAMENGNVTILKASWNKVCEDEFLSFPNGVKDDFVDSDSLAFNIGARIRIT